MHKRIEVPVRRSWNPFVRPNAQVPSPTGPKSARFRWQIHVVGLVGLLVRLVYVWQISDAPFVDVLMGDARRYDEWAVQIAAGNWIGRDVFYQAPLYPYFLGTIYGLAGRDLLTVRICQAFVGAGACVLLGLAGRRMYSERVGLLGGLGLALYAPAVFFDALIQKSVLDIFFVCLVLFIVSGLLDEPQRRMCWLALGISLGALALTRENAAVLAAAILLWPPGRRQLSHQQRAAMAGALLAGFALILLPVAIRNRVVGGEWHLTTSQLGPNLYIGNNPAADGTYGALREGRGAPEYERQDATDIAEAAAGRRLTPGEVSSFWVRRSLQFIQSQPIAWLELMTRKAALLWNRTEFVDTESQASYEDYSSLLRGLALAGHFGLLVPLAALGIITTWSSRSRLYVLYALGLAYAASTIMFYVSARYRLPLVPMLMLAAAAGGVSLGGFLRTAGGLKIAAAAAVVGAVAIATNQRLVSDDLMRATTETNLGVALHMDGKIHEAEARYRRALEVQPDYAPAHVNLGMALTALRRWDEAIAAYTRARQLGSSDVDLNTRLGYALLQAGRPAEAADHLSAAVDAGRGSAETYNNLGIALTRANRYDEAIAAFGNAVRLDPNNATVRFTLGSLLASRGRFDEAINEFRAGVDLMPNSAEGHNNLGGALAASGRRAEAIAEFEHALRLNPNLTSARRNLDLVRRQ